MSTREDLKAILAITGATQKRPWTALSEIDGLVRKALWELDQNGDLAKAGVNVNRPISVGDFVIYEDNVSPNPTCYEVRNVKPESNFILLRAYSDTMFFEDINLIKLLPSGDTP